nr:dTDP-fucosamine acetyltransferase [Paraburkholderia busanensis]
MNFTLSEIDRERFGVVTAKAVATDPSGVEQIFAECVRLGVQFLILRVASSDLAVTQLAEARGAFIADTLLYFERQTDTGLQAMLPAGVRLRTASAADGEAIAILAAQIFRNYDGHYHADARLPRDKADIVYSSWAHACCVNDKVADAVLIVERDDEMLGFAALKLSGADSVDVSLLGISPAARREGLFRVLLQASAQWGAQRGLGTLEYSTQLTNVAVQRGLSKAGFLPVKSCYTLHKWFD